MIARRLTTLLATMLLGMAIATPARAATPAPSWSIHGVAAPTNFAPGESSGVDLYEVTVANNGAEVTDSSEITISDTLPAGLTVKSVELPLRIGSDTKEFAEEACETETVSGVSTVTCTITEALPAKEPAKLYPAEQLRMVIRVAVPPTAAGTLENRVEVQGGGAEPASLTSHNQASAEPAPPGFQEFHAELTGVDGKPLGQAGGHPFQYTTSFAINTEIAPPGAASPLAPARGDIKDIEVALPPGLIGNPTATARCTAQQFNTIHGFILPEGVNLFQNSCPDGSVVGMIVVQQIEGVGGVVPQPIYNLVPPKGMPAQLGFQIVGVPFYIDTELRSDSDYGVSARLRNTSEAKRVTAASVSIWGTPAAAVHDRLRGNCLNSIGGFFSIGNCPSGIVDPGPFFRLPTSCASALDTTMTFNLWNDPLDFQTAVSGEPAPSGCEQVDFSPTIEARPTTNVADSPSGLHFNLHIPQNQDVDGLGEADLKDATVTLPEGLLVNPASADGLAGCSLAQIGYQGVEGGRPSFSAAPANCPDAAKIGTVEVDTPLLEEPLPGGVYLARQSENPFNSLFALYIVVADPQSGVVVKLPGEITPNPQTGQLTTTVLQGPQLPFEDFKLDFFQGARAPLRTPPICATHTTTTDLRPWSAPESGPDATPSDSFAIAAAPGGGSCPTTRAGLPNAPSFEAGTAGPLAGAYSPFLLRLRREDGSQELTGLNVSLPAGLTAKLAGVGECSEAQLAQATSRQAPGQGAAELASPSCPPSSRLGSVTVGAGAGPAPFHVTGDAYLAGPYKGAPLSMAIVTPAVAGPFDLGSVVVRAGLYVDRETAKVTVKSDPIPSILQGIPLDVRSIAVRIDRNQFTLNPTSCDPAALTAEAISSQGGVALLSNRFQVGGCSNLSFKPKLSLKLKGGIARGAHPALSATLTMPPGGANVSFAQVSLPHSEFLDTTHIRTICTRVQFAANSCPAGAIYGTAKALTPLLDKPLEGPVYLRSSSNPLPDVVADLEGQVDVALVGRVSSVGGGTRTTFEGVPDAPVTKFTLNMRGAKKGLFVNSRNLCAAPSRAEVDFTSQSGKAVHLRPLLENGCKKKGKHKRGNHSRSRGGG